MLDSYSCYCCGRDLRSCEATSVPSKISSFGSKLTFLFYVFIVNYSVLIKINNFKLSLHIHRDSSSRSATTNCSYIFGHFVTFLVVASESLSLLFFFDLLISLYSSNIPIHTILPLT